MATKPYNPEAVNLTATEVASILKSGWGNATIDWSKVKVAQGTDATNGTKQIVLTVDQDLISATDLTDANKINSTNATDSTKGYKISFAKKGAVKSTNKLVLVAANDKVTTTFITK